MEHAGQSVKRADAITNRAKIIEAAQAVFAERELDIEVGEVAARAGLGVGTLYRHFTNRDDLLRAVLIRNIEDALAQLQSAIEPLAADPSAALQAVVLAGLHVRRRSGPLFGVMRDPRLTKLLDQAQAQTIRDRFLGVTMGIIESGIEAGIFRRDIDQEVAAATIIGSLSGVLDLLGKRWSIEELAQRLFHLHLAMLSPVPC
jgi:AcrR family transcriptional regulator